MKLVQKHPLFVLSTLLLSIICLPTTLFAAQSSADLNQPFSFNQITSFFRAQTYYAEAGFGNDWRHLRDGNMFISHQAGWPDDIDSVNSVNNAALLLVGGGLVWIPETQWFPYNSVGVEYSYGLPANIKGNIEQFSYQAFQNNYSYRYRISRNTLMLIGKTDIACWYNIMPYVELGLGATWNKVENYVEEAAVGITPRISPGFLSKVNTDFTYAIGAGLDYKIQQNLLLSIGYRYDWFGQVNTGGGVDTFSGSSLNNKLYANTVLARIRYSFF